MKKSHLFIFVFSISISISILLKIFFKDYINIVTKESYFVENLTAILFFISGWISVWSIFKSKKNYILKLLGSIFSFICFSDETSFLQYFSVYVLRLDKALPKFSRILEKIFLYFNQYLHILYLIIFITLIFFYYYFNFPKLKFWLKKYIIDSLIFYPFLLILIASIIDKYQLVFIDKTSMLLIEEIFELNAAFAFVIIFFPLLKNKNIY